MKFNTIATLSIAAFMFAVVAACSPRIEQQASAPMQSPVQAVKNYTSNPAMIKQLIDTKQCQACDLKGADLSRADLKGANLQEADLRGANLSQADLSDANLIQADLRGANLNRGNLNRAKLTSALMSWTGDQIPGGYDRANLQQANLSGANLITAYLRGVDLSEADLRGASTLR